MAFFKFRKRSDEPSTLPVQPESIDVMRKRAKHRLLGAAVLVLAGVLGFPILFDKQPRPIAVDIPIEIPDRAKVRPLSIPVPPVAPKADEAASAASPRASAPEVVAAPAPVPVAPQSVASVTRSEAKVPAASSPRTTDDGRKAQALLGGKDSERKVDAALGRFVVQVGAFADAARAREVRLKVEHTGLKTYTQVVEAKQGRRIRVRVGPFVERAEADSAAEKIRKLNLPATTLSL